MKIGGSVFLWSLVVLYFQRRTTWKEDNTHRRPLTFDQVKSEFDSTPAPRRGPLVLEEWCAISGVPIAEAQRSTTVGCVPRQRLTQISASVT
jgi:hypothetical protein